VLRDAVAETSLRACDFIVPIFVVPGTNQRQEIVTMPGVLRFSLDTLIEEVSQCVNLGLKAIMIFGVLPADQKDALGSSATDANSLVPAAVRALRTHFGAQISIFTDVCLCTHTSHGHCGVLNGESIDNDATLPLLAEMALVHARAGADFVCPSDMMDGRIGFIREFLDQAGLSDVGILAYSAKYASSFYAPFREAAASSPSFGDRKTYQMDYRNAREALLEAALDEQEGADMLMVKPALSYLDIIARVRGQTGLPLVAYNVSGEYAMLMAAAQAGVLEEERSVREVLMSIKRAGADLIVSYHAKKLIAQGWNL
jgi:porphobilinogen synthase